MCQGGIVTFHSGRRSCRRLSVRMRARRIWSWAHRSQKRNRSESNRLEMQRRVEVARFLEVSRLRGFGGISLRFRLRVREGSGLFDVGLIHCKDRRRSPADAPQKARPSAAIRHVSREPSSDPGFPVRIAAAGGRHRLGPARCALRRHLRGACRPPRPADTADAGAASAEAHQGPVGRGRARGPGWRTRTSRPSAARPISSTGCRPTAPR